jgi:hypothetical protein
MGLELTLFNIWSFIGPINLAFSFLSYIPAKGKESEFVDIIAKIVGAA